MIGILISSIKEKCSTAKWTKKSLHTYKPDDPCFFDANECIPCPTEFNVTVDTGSTSLDHCRYGGCISGQILNPAYNASSDIREPPCINCPMGTYQPIQSPIEEECLACPPGFWTQNEGSSNAASCEGKKLNSLC